MEEIKKCKRLLKESAESSLRRGYKGDWAETMSKVYVLELLEEIVKQKELLEKILKQKIKRNPSAYNLFIAEETSKGLTFIEAIKKWKKKQESKCKG